MPGTQAGMQGFYLGSDARKPEYGKEKASPERESQYGLDFQWVNTVGNFDCFRHDPLKNDA